MSSLQVKFAEKQDKSGQGLLPDVHEAAVREPTTGSSSSANPEGKKSTVCIVRFCVNMHSATDAAWSM